MEYDMRTYSIFIILCSWIIVRGKTEYQEICDDTELMAECQAGSALLVKSALFGRMRIGKCVEKDLGYLGCQNDVLNLADRWCSGKERCVIPVSNPDLNKINTACLRDLNSYLEIEYTCVPVVNPGALCSSSSRIKVQGNEGYISSHVTYETGCGSPSAPWIIEAQPGQTVNLVLIDFGALDRDQHALYTSCQALYGFIIERELGVNFTMCGGTERKKHLYKSKTNKVELHMLRQEENGAFRYFVQYSFVGCADLTPPEHAWYKRDENEAMIGCKANDRVWRLSCKGSTWDGVVGNCSRSDMANKGTRDRFVFTFSSVILLTCVVCGAALLIIVVVVAGTVYVKKQRIRHDIKLRSDYGLLPQAQYYTLRAGCGINTMTSANTQTPGDSQPLVFIADKDTTKGNVPPSDCTSATMTKPFTTNQPIVNEKGTSHGNLI